MQVIEYNKQAELIVQLEDHMEQLQTISTPYRSKSTYTIEVIEYNKQAELIIQLEDHVEQLQTISTPYRS